MPLTFGDIHIYVRDLDEALQFWEDGLGLILVDRDDEGAFARLDFPGGGPIVELIASVDVFELLEPAALCERPAVSFDVTTSDFDDVLVRLLENGGRQEGAIETYRDLRIVTVADPDGNAFELIEVPSEA